MKFAPGVVFDPSDREIVSHYLPKLIEGNGDLGFLGRLSYLFNVCDVYSTKPSLLFDFVMNKNNMQSLPCLLKGNERFFFSNRVTIAKKNASGKRPRRTLHQSDQQKGEDGFWKSSTGEKPILDDKDKLLGYVNVLNFYEYNNKSNNNEKKNRKNATKSSMIMYEYRLRGDRFQEWVVCKIKDTSRGEEDLCEAVWLDQLFSSDGMQRLAERQSLPLQRHECLYPSCRQSLINNLVALQAQEAAPPLNFHYGYNGFIINDEQGSVTCINNPWMDMEIKSNQDYAAETKRICSEIEADLGVEFVDYGTWEYGSQAETESLRQQPEAGYLNPYESVTVRNILLLEQPEEAAALTETHKDRVDINAEISWILMDIEGQKKSYNEEFPASKADTTGEYDASAAEISMEEAVEKEEKKSEEFDAAALAEANPGEDDAELSRFVMDIEAGMEIEEEEKCYNDEVPASMTACGGEDGASTAHKISTDVAEEEKKSDQFDAEVDLAIADMGLEHLELPDGLPQLVDEVEFQMMHSSNKILSVADFLTF